jgi:hypothetical protein
MTEDQHLPTGLKDFDTDLDVLFPELRADPEIQAAREATLWVIHQPQKVGEELWYAHPATWGGVGALAFREELVWERDQFGHGSISMDGAWGSLALMNGTVCSPVAMWDVIRMAWIQGYAVRVDGGLWFDAGTVQSVFRDLMYHVRGWTELGPSAVGRVKERARDWARRVAVRGLMILG